MDREVIEQKLESLRRCLHRISERCPSDPATLGRDPDLQDIVTLKSNHSCAIVRGPWRTSHCRPECSAARYDGPNLRCAGPGWSYPRTASAADQEGRGLSEYCRASLRGNRLGDCPQYCTESLERFQRIRQDRCRQIAPMTIRRGLAENDTEGRGSFAAVERSISNRFLVEATI